MSRLPVILPDAGLGGRAADSEPVLARGIVGVPGWLADRQGRGLRYLRLSVTDRCDLRCAYCMPEDGIAASPREEVLSFEEIVRVARVFVRLGVRTVRLTGGEPLVRRGLVDLVRMLYEEAGVSDVAMTTNATALAAQARGLVAAGLSRINVSLDSLDPETFARMTRGGDVSRVIAGIEAALEAGVRELKTNTVVVRGMNEGAFGRIVDWAWARGITPRMIELMPLGEGAALGADAVVSVREMQACLADRIAIDASVEHRMDRGPAGYLFARDGSGNKVGFIGAVTDNFCERCNRVRLTARGEIRACLASPEGLSLKDLLRSGAGDDAIVAAVEDALYGKRKGHEFYEPGVTRHHAVHMSCVGG